ncbi:MAG: hypothetical protein ABJG73_14360 [Tateyamaria sp.]
MPAGLADSAWEAERIVKPVEKAEAETAPRKRGSYKKKDNSK